MRSLADDTDDIWPISILCNTWEKRREERKVKSKENIGHTVHTVRHYYSEGC